jgi:putative ABC transport system permease protein
MRSRAERWYRRLLVLLPASLRAEAEDELVALFRDDHARVASVGPIAAARFWARMIADLIVASAAERASLRRRARQTVVPDPTPSRRPAMRVLLLLHHVMSDLRLALRRFARTPGWTLVSAGTLALGLAGGLIGGVLVRDVLMRPLPFDQPDRLVRIVEVSGNGGRWWPSFPNAADWREHGRMFDGVGVADIPTVKPVLLDGRAVRVPVSRAGRGLFETLRVRPAAGRLFADDENRPGGEPAAIVSERFWRRDLHAAAPGEASVTVGATRYTVVGVLPDGFRFLGDGAVWTSPADIWTPLDRDTGLGSRTSHGYHVVARMRDGLTLDQVRGEMNQLAARLRIEHGQPTQAHTVLLTPLQDLVVRSAREPLRLLLYASGALLLVSCLNLAAAILAQGLNRAQELRVRLALGASRWTLARHLLVDAAALALPATVLGLLAAAGAFQVIKRSAPGTLPRLDETAMDPSSALAACALAAVAACLAGLLPALLLSRHALSERLRTHGATTGPREQRRLWAGFVAAQVAVTVALLAGTGLLVRSFVAALSVDVGYDAGQVIAVDVALPEPDYAVPERRLAFYAAALDRLRASAGIEEAGLTSALPHITSVYTSGTHRDMPDPKVAMAGYRLVDRAYFDVMGIRRLQGDPGAIERGAVIDRRLVDLLWNGQSALGDRVVNGFAREALPVAGVVGTVREWDQQEAAFGAVYQDYRRRPDRLLAMHLVVRYTGGTAAALRSVRQALADVDPMVPVTIEPLSVRAAESLGGRRLLLLMASGFGMAALFLAGAGVYAMVSFAVARQTRESAIRLALGAHPASLGRRTILQGCLPAAAGVIAGLALALAIGPAMRTQLFQVQPRDPVVLLAAALAMIAAAVIAALHPARRASRVNPAAALRQE